MKSMEVSMLDRQTSTQPSALSLSVRQLGSVMVVQCRGRIVAGREANTLKEYVDSLLQDCRTVVLDVGDVTFVDSSGLGMLVRIFMASGAVGVKLKLCTLSAYLQDLLRLTSLAPVFETYASVEDAVVAAYGREIPWTVPARRGLSVLCVDRSRDVLAYVSEILSKAGYDVLTNTNVYDSLILIRATNPDVVLLGPDLYAAPGTVQKFRAACEKNHVIQLGNGFSTEDAATAAPELLRTISTVLRRLNKVA